jgi:hypothetical protein
VRPHLGQQRRDVLCEPLRRGEAGVLMRTPLPAVSSVAAAHRRLSDILVEQAAERFRFVSRDHRVNEEEQLMLSLG